VGVKKGKVVGGCFRWILGKTMREGGERKKHGKEVGGTSVLILSPTFLAAGMEKKGTHRKPESRGEGKDR